jgi:hypothetical protein
MNNSTLTTSKKANTFIFLGGFFQALSFIIPHDTTTWIITRTGIIIVSVTFAMPAYFSKKENRTAKGYWLIGIMFIIALMALLYPLLFSSLFKK